jgi:GDP-mannose 6-dehydrogenase
MKISVFGLGYVGVVTAACLAREGHKIIGVDVQPIKVDMINSGQSPIIEEQIDKLVFDAVSNGSLKATLDSNVAVKSSDLAIVCVGTPSKGDGSLDNQYITQVVSQIGRALREREAPFYIVIRSTVLPGTLRDLVIPTLEQSCGRALGDGYEVTFHPEFLREGTSVSDFYNPPKIVVGEASPGSSQKVLDLYSAEIEAPRIVCSIEVAEMLKYCDNLFHALKITFANEVGQFCRCNGIDSQEVMSIFCQDTKLNLSAKYLKPGFAFGGSCLPKDLRAFLSVARMQNLKLPMLENVIVSNQQQIERSLDLVLSTNASRIGFHGIAFKPGTDDLRESPLVELGERLLGKGKKLVIFDEKVQIARLIGGNKSYVEQVFPHLAGFLTEQIDRLLDCEVVLIGHPVSEECLQNYLKNGIKVMDLTGTLSRRYNPAIFSIV